MAEAETLYLWKCWFCHMIFFGVTGKPTYEINDCASATVHKVTLGDGDIY